MSKTMIWRRIAVAALMLSGAVRAHGDLANMQTLSLVDKLIEADIQMQREGGTGLIQLPAGVSLGQFVNNANKWLNGEDSMVIPEKMRVDLFGLYWITAQIPFTSVCYQDATSSACEQDFMEAAKRVRPAPPEFKRDYKNASKLLGLPAAFPEKWTRTAEPQQPPERTNPLPMPHPQALMNADRQCDDLALSSGRQSFGEACKRANHRGVDALQAMRTDPEIRPEFWAACSNAVGFQVSANFEGWAQCVKFVRTSCATSKVTGDEDTRRCLRAIQSHGWILNRAAQ